MPLCRTPFPISPLLFLLNGTFDTMITTRSSLITLTCLGALALTGCGRGEGGASVGIGVSTDQSRSSGTTQGSDVTHGARTGRSTDQTASISQPAARVINLALLGGKDLRPEGLRQIRSGHSPLAAYAAPVWPDGSAVADVLSMAAAFATGSVEFWEVTPTSLRARAADGHGSPAETAYVETLDSAACVVNIVGGAMADSLAQHRPVFGVPDDALAEAKRLVADQTQANVQPVIAHCVAESKARQRRLGQDIPRWSAQDYALTTSKGGVVVSANGSESWFGKSHYSGVAYELRFARANSFALDNSTARKTGTSDDAKTTTTGSVSVGK